MWEESVVQQHSVQYEKKMLNSEKSKGISALFKTHAHTAFLKRKLRYVVHTDVGFHSGS